MSLGTSCTIQERFLVIQQIFLEQYKIVQYVLLKPFPVHHSLLNYDEQ